MKSSFALAILANLCCQVYAYLPPGTYSIKSASDTALVLTELPNKQPIFAQDREVPYQYWEVKPAGPGYTVQNDATKAFLNCGGQPLGGDCTTSSKAQLFFIRPELRGAFVVQLPEVDLTWRSQGDDTVLRSAPFTGSEDELFYFQHQDN
jgi:hypothetical protein